MRHGVGHRSEAEHPAQQGDSGPIGQTPEWADREREQHKPDGPKTRVIDRRDHGLGTQIPGSPVPSREGARQQRAGERDSLQPREPAATIKPWHSDGR